MIRTRAYWVVRPGEGELRAAALPSSPPLGRSLIRAEFTGISAGTERLVGQGRVPAALDPFMACVGMEGSFALPVKYGYSFVGVGMAGALLGRRVFTMHPHQGVACVDDAATTTVPENVPAERATLAPLLETALNAVWDAELKPGEKPVIVGAGTLGVLLAYVLSQHHIPCVVVETHPERARFIRSLPWISESVHADAETLGTQIAFHATGTEAGLRTAIECLGFEGRVIDLSWYGNQSVRLELGASFHYERKRLISSQVAAIAPSQRFHTTHASRLAQVMSLLASSELDHLLASPLPFSALPAFMAELYRGTMTPSSTVIDYKNENPL